jgi:hypothetical protein
MATDRTSVVSVKMTEKEKHLLKMYAARVDSTMSDVAREAIFKELEKASDKLDWLIEARKLLKEDN